MSPLDQQLITRKSKLILEDLEKIKVFLDLQIEEYLNSYDHQLKSERLLEKIIGRLIDINYHILKENFKLVPTDYYNSFMDLGENDVIDNTLAQDLAQAAGMRNILAHEYDTIDSRLVFTAIEKLTKQVPEYLKQVQAKF